MTPINTLNAWVICYNLYFLDIQKFGIEISKDGIHPSLKGYNDLGLKLSEIFRKEFD